MHRSYSDGVVLIRPDSSYVELTSDSSDTLDLLDDPCRLNAVQILQLIRTYLHVHQMTSYNIIGIDVSINPYLPNREQSEIMLYGEPYL